MVLHLVGSLEYLLSSSFNLAMVIRSEAIIQYLLHLMAVIHDVLVRYGTNVHSFRHVLLELFCVRDGDRAR